jgi:ribosome-associated protein
MMTDDGLHINDDLVVSVAELTYRATRSGGPGGQHVNTSATRIELTWDVSGSPSLTDAQRARIMDRLANRIDSRGVLRIVESGSRSQLQNRETVTDRFVELLAGALRNRRPRRKTKPSRAVKEKRLREKKRQGEKKKQRGPVRAEE